MPLWLGRRLRKRWRYVGFWGQEMMVCAARIEVGPAGQTFWAVLDRERGELRERTRTRVPGRTAEVWTEGAGIGAEGATLTNIASDGVRAALRTEPGPWVESVSRDGPDAYTWTRKRAGQIVCELTVGERTLTAVGPGLEDESAGYHRRHTVWSWSAGAGVAREGQEVAWNLVSGINDPESSSERTIWADGVATEPAPVTFEGLDAVIFSDGSRLEFEAEAERRRSDNLLLIRSRYRQPFGSFSGSLPGVGELSSGLGVMEHHEARW